MLKPFDNFKKIYLLSFNFIKTLEIEIINKVWVA